MNNVSQRARNAMLGLAIGDASSWTAMFHRSLLLPPWTRRIRREIDAASETTNVIATPMPFSLNRPAEHFNISPTDDTEWAAFSADILLRVWDEGGAGDGSGAGAPTAVDDTYAAEARYTEAVGAAWMILAHSPDPIRGGVSTQAALHNLRLGLLPPQSGRENPHYFDDGAMPRAVPIGIMCAGMPDTASRMAAIDACVTNSEDGVWAAQAMAVAVSLLCAGNTIDEAIRRARLVLPASSWIARLVADALSLADGAESIFSILPRLHDTVVNREYSYGNAAPETLALAFAIARLHGTDFAAAVTASTGLAKSGETLPAIVGALSGAMHSTAVAGKHWLKAVELVNGICLPGFAGMNYITLTERLSAAAEQKLSS